MSTIARRVAPVAVVLALLVAVAAGLGQAQSTTTLKVQAAWPPASMLFDSSKHFVERVGKLSGGRLKIEMLPSGAVVPPFESLEATARGVLDGAHTAPAYWVGKNKAAALFGPAPGGPFTPGSPFGAPRGDSTAAWADQVDRPVALLGRSRVPRYPDVLQRSRQEGSVVALFVVDTLGAVEPNSFRTASSTHALFTESVRLVVLSMRFKPAEVAGRPVRQMVQQRFVFELTP